MRVLVVNAGSSSVKLRLLDGGDAVLGAQDLDRLPQDEVGPALDDFMATHPGFDAVGHRVVHGGAAYRRPILVDAGADRVLEDLAELAPLHNPPCLAALHELRIRRPDVPQVACFDTTFHADMPTRAATYALPRRWREEWGIQRYGFHGLSHAWAASRAAALLGRPLDALRLITAHLGSGASLAAVAGGRSVDTTMGFTPLEGLVMSTRSGTVDPGAVLWAVQHSGEPAAEVEADLEHRSGLLGLSGTSGDLREVMRAAATGDADAGLAYEVYVYRIQTSVGAMAVALGGVDGLVFTGGAGQASSRLRADTCAGLGVLGIDVLQDEGGPGDRVVSAPGARPAVVVVEAREDLEIARQVRAVLGAAPPAAG